jgi:hypothetical protein
MSVETKSKEATCSSESGNNVPSGFILKLFQMVNGAPDEVISVRTFIFYRNSGSVDPLYDGDWFTGCVPPRYEATLRFSTESVAIGQND